MTTPLERLAQRVKERRLELGLASEKAARSVGMSKDTWRRVERGESVRELTYARIEHVLQWAQGSCAAIRAGRESISIEEAGGGVLHEVPDALEAEVRQAVTNATIAMMSSLTASEIRALNDQVVKELRGRGILPDDTDQQS